MSRTYRITRELTVADRDGGADAALGVGSVVYEYTGHTYGMLREPWIAVCLSPDGPFFGLRSDAVEQVEGAVVFDVTAELRSAAYEPAGYNEYGSVVTPGYKVEESGAYRCVRVEHKLPECDLSDPNRASSDERHLARLAARDAYAATLRGAGWVVEERMVMGNRPILFASREVGVS